MRCKKCGQENREGAVFCAGCGATLNNVEKEKYKRDIYSYTPPEAPATPPPVNVNITSPDNSIPSEYAPISMWGYLGYEILFGLPVVGWIILIIFALGTNPNKNVTNFARSYFCFLILGIVIVIVLVVTGVFSSTFHFMQSQLL